MNEGSRCKFNNKKEEKATKGPEKTNGKLVTLNTGWWVRKKKKRGAA